MFSSVFLAAAALVLGPSDEHPLTQQQRSALDAAFASRLETLNQRIADDPKSVELYSNRGSVRFFLGQFAESVADFDQMIELDPKQAVEHWRRGISLYYLGRYEESAKQFEHYHAYDNVDRENGIWRFFAQAKVVGAEQARKELLRYEKNDREPFPDLYEMCAGRMTPEQVLRHIEDADVDRVEKDKRRFFGQFYVGFLAWTDGDRASAVKHVHEAVANAWAQQHAGYMWQTARVHYEFMHRTVTSR